MDLPPAYQTGFQLKMLSLKTGCGDALSGTTHCTKKKKSKKGMERKPSFVGPQTE